MSNIARYTVLVAMAAVVIVIVSLFIGFLLRLALLAALLAIAYYWFIRAAHIRRDKRWR